MDLEAEKRRIVERHGPWTAHNIRLGPGVFTISALVLNIEEKARRTVQLVADLAGAPLSELRVLDLGSGEGAFALELALHGAEVLAIEGREANIAKAEFARRALGQERVRFERADVRSLSPEIHGRFDVTFCLGLLYHLDAASVVGLIHAVRRVTRRFAIVDTHFALRPSEEFEAGGKVYRGASFREHDEGASDEQKQANVWAALDNERSFWLSRASLINCLTDAGFTSVLEVMAPFTYDYYDRADLRRLKYPDRSWFVAWCGEPQELRSHPGAAELSPRRFPEDLGDRLLPSPLDSPSEDGPADPGRHDARSDR